MENEIIMEDMHSLPPTSKNILKYQYEKIRTPTIFPRVADEAPVEFLIEARSDSMVDVKNIRLAVRCKIRKYDQDGTVVNLDAGDRVVPYCGFLYTMWSDIQVDLQHRSFYKSRDYYDLLTYLQILYCVPNDIKDGQLVNALWAKDREGGHNLIMQDEAGFPGEFYRSNVIRGSRTVDMLGKLYLDCFNINRPYPDGLDISIKFYPNVPNKCLLWADDTLDACVEIEEMFLIVPRLVVRPPLLKQPAKIPYINTSVHRFMLSAGFETFGPRTILTTDTLPRKCVIVILTETQLNGHYQQNRLSWDHYGVRQILLTLNGEHIPKHDGYDNLDFGDNNKFSELYEAIYQYLGKPNTVAVPRREFKHGFVVFPFDLTQRNLSSEFYPPKRSGALDLTIQFAGRLPDNVAILAFLEEERVLTIDKNREWKDVPV